jgi:hypothetical protein
VIQAFQMTKERRASNADWPEWMHRAWQLDRETPGSLYPTEAGTGDGTLSIGTLGGQHLVSWGDWIIQGVSGLTIIKSSCYSRLVMTTKELIEALIASGLTQREIADEVVASEALISRILSGQIANSGEHVYRAMLDLFMRRGGGA